MREQRALRERVLKQRLRRTVAEGDLAWTADIGNRFFLLHVARWTCPPRVTAHHARHSKSYLTGQWTLGTERQVLDEFSRWWLQSGSRVP